MSGVIVETRCATASELRSLRAPWPGVSDITCHRAVRKRLRLALSRASRFSDFQPRRIDSFVCRPIRGSSVISKHGKGAAWDIFATPPSQPPPGGVWHPDDTFGRPFAACFTDLGFTWGSQWQREDWPHLEWSGGYVPRVTISERIRTWRLARERYRERHPGKGRK